MTETTAGPSAVHSPRPLFRDPEAGKLAGVCAGIARYTDTDPVIWRVVAVVLTVFGGTGAILYLLGWLLLPKRQPDGTIPLSWLARRGHSLNPTALTILALIAIFALGGLNDSRGVGAAAVIALVAYLVHRDRQGQLAAPSAAAAAPVTVPAYEPPPPYVRVARERSRLGLVTLSIAAIVSGCLAWIAVAGGHGATAGRILAVALAIVGTGLVIGTWYGRAHWLIPIGLILSMGVGAAAAADAAGVSLAHGAGDRTWVVSEGRTSQSFALGVGAATLDLSTLSSSGPHIVVRGDVSAGRLLILVPANVAVRVHAKARFGQIDEFGATLVGGRDHVERTRSYGPPGDPRIEVEATVGTGQIEVQHA